MSAFPPNLSAPARTEKSNVMAGEHFLDVIALSKPRITFFVLLTTLGGLWLGARHLKLHPPEAVFRGAGVTPSIDSVTPLLITCTLVGTMLIVSGANALNMFFERQIDGQMLRTKNRPLPAGRMAPKTALIWGISWSVLALPILAAGVNLLTALLAMMAHLGYVFAYTPLKTRSYRALFVGAAAGAIPPLLGWTAATAYPNRGGLVLFAILFLWQIPHFLSISMFRYEEYANAKLIVMPLVRSDLEVKHTVVRYCAALLGASVLLYPLQIAGRMYLTCASILGVFFLALALYGLSLEEGAEKRSKWRWSKSLFATSLFYLLFLFISLGLDAL